MRPAARRDILAQVAYYLDELAYEAAGRFRSPCERRCYKLSSSPE